MVSHGFPRVDSGQHIDRCNENGDPWLNCFLIFVDNYWECLVIDYVDNYFYINNYLFLELIDIYYLDICWLLGMANNDQQFLIMAKNGSLITVLVSSHLNKSSRWRSSSHIFEANKTHYSSHIFGKKHINHHRPITNHYKPQLTNIKPTSAV